LEGAFSPLFTFFLDTEIALMSQGPSQQETFFLFSVLFRHGNRLDVTSRLMHAQGPFSFIFAPFPPFFSSYFFDGCNLVGPRVSLSPPPPPSLSLCLFRSLSRSRSRSLLLSTSLSFSPPFLSLLLSLNPPTYSRRRG
jgi:hypothetical protein